MILKGYKVSLLLAVVLETVSGFLKQSLILCKDRSIYVFVECPIEAKEVIGYYHGLLLYSWLRRQYLLREFTEKMSLLCLPSRFQSERPSPGLEFLMEAELIGLHGLFSRHSAACGKTRTLVILLKIEPCS